MPRATNNPASRRRRKKILKQAKGYWGLKSKVYRRAREAVDKALKYAYRDRKVKKREFRRLWITRINAAVREEGMKYSEFIYKLNKANIKMDRKVLSDLAIREPEIFKEIVRMLKGEGQQAVG